MATIKVMGRWVFGDTSISFVFADGQQIEFGSITDMKTFRAALVTVAKVGTDIYLQSILGDAKPTQNTAENDQVSRVQQQVNGVLERAEASFREQQRKTEAALKKAQDDYEAATSTVIGSAAGTPGA